MRHVLKCWPEQFQDIVDRRKRFELRLCDRTYAVGDVLELREFKPDSAFYTGRQIDVQVLHMMVGGKFGLARQFVVMSICPVEDLERAKGQSE